LNTQVKPNRSKYGYADSLPDLSALLVNADHVDVKTVTSRQSLREFAAGMLNYQPVWMTALYGVRAVFVRFLGMKQERIPRPPAFTANSLPMTVGAKAAFFSVAKAQEDAYWFAEVVDQHLTAKLGIVMEPLVAGQNRFHVYTIVHYNNWAGPVYFNVIRPFHHIVVDSMVRAGAAV
jgi:hypothetical protein